jgi:hypothetical protein
LPAGTEARVRSFIKDAMVARVAVMGRLLFIAVAVTEGCSL